MRIVVAGGNGFIGRRLTSELNTLDHEVVWLSHRLGRIGDCPQNERPAREYPFDPVADSLSHTWREALVGADVVANLSGTPIAARWNSATKDMLRASRVTTARALIEAIATIPPEQRPLAYVSASGIGIYGDRGADVLTEREPPGSDWLSQLACEWEAEAARAKDAGLRVAIVRTGLVLGSEGFLPRLALPMRLFAGGPIGNGRQYVPWIHHTDIARAYVHAIVTPTLNGPLHAVAPEQLTMSEFSATLGRVLHRPSWLRVPAWGLRMVLGEVAPYTLFSQRAEPHVLRATGFEFEFEHAEEALADLLGD